METQSVKTLNGRYTSINYFGEFGTDFDSKVVDQICTAARLPVALGSAVMPDAHVGYALPIGGVIALDDSVSPNFVGYDIACRMKLTIFDHLSAQDFKKERPDIFKAMHRASSFGIGAEFQKGDLNEHKVMDDPLWDEIPLLREHKATARKQLGSSGSGNHFFNFMEGAIIDGKALGLNQDAAFMGIMTHSGSRGVGHKCATYYNKKAKEFVKDRSYQITYFQNIPNGYEWLPLDYDLGAEYWQVMQLMGRYASANHECIHRRFFKYTGLRPLITFENHHNFAWKTEAGIVHRKGATPAETGQFGIIPGSGQTSSFVCMGRGNPDSLNSSSHGAGRVGSRTQAKKDVNVDDYLKQLEDRDIWTSGVAADETYQAYKDIDRVINLQVNDNILSVVAVMRPKMVLMGGDNRPTNLLNRKK